jgi:hypothetical protein
VDFIYRSMEHVERVIADAQAGRFETDYPQQPPFGFFGPTYLGEIEICIPLHDPERRIDALKKRVTPYPEQLRRAVVQDYLWQAEFALSAFAQKVAVRGDTYGTASCLTRAVNQLTLVLFALNGKYLLNDKTVLSEISEFSQAPAEFESRVQKALSQLGTSPEKLFDAVQNVEQLFRETAKLAADLYRPRFTFPFWRESERLFMCPSPLGRRWPEGPDEGQSPFGFQPRKRAPHPAFGHPLPRGEGSREQAPTPLLP